MDKLSQGKLVAGVDVQDRIRDARSSSTGSRYSVNIIETQYVSSPSEDRTSPTLDPNKLQSNVTSN